MPGPSGGDRRRAHDHPALDWVARVWGGYLGQQISELPTGVGGPSEIDWRMNEMALDNQHADADDLARQLHITNPSPPKPKDDIVRRALPPKGTIKGVHKKSAKKKRR